jgi:hypothetical protein
MPSRIVTVSANTTPEFNLRVIPDLRTMRFEIQRGAFTGEPLGGRLTTDDFARVDAVTRPRRARSSSARST